MDHVDSMQLKCRGPVSNSWPSAVRFLLLRVSIVASMLLLPGVTYAQSCPTGVQIMAPASGQVLPSQQAVVVEATLVPNTITVESNPVKIRAIMSATGGGFFPIAEGDLRMRGTPGSLRGIWNLNNVPSGTYSITVVVQAISRAGRCSPVQATVEVVVNRAPSLLDLQATNCQVGETGTTVAFQAIAQDPENDSMVQFLWNPGDGTSSTVTPSSTSTSGNFVHVYPSAASVVVWVTGYESRGGMFMEGRDFDVASCAFLQAQAAPRRCGCDRMTIASRAGNNSEIYCFMPPPPPQPPAVAPPVVAPGERFGCTLVANPPAGACPALQRAFTCPLGPQSTPNAVGDDALNWRFEVRAVLNAASNDPAQCDEGQFAKGTRIRGFPAIVRGRLALVLNVEANPVTAATPPAGAYQFPNNGNFNVVGPPNGYPLFRPENNTFGADDYAVPFVFKRDRDADRIRYWYDAPGSSSPPRTSSVFSNNDEFVSFVRSRGNLGTCWCHYRIQHQWIDGTGRRAFGGGDAPNVVEMVAGNNCNIP